MPLKRGDRLGVYEVVEAVGAGGMGEVFRAHDTTLGREAAVKVLPDDLIASPDRRARLEREARLLAQLNHPHIAAVYGIGIDGAVPYLAMEFVPGTTLASEITRGPLAVPEVIRIFQQLTDALTAAHERGIVHRDLKPANIMRSTDGGIKVLDFGLAKAFEAEGDAADATVTGVATRAGIVLGTAAYMSPEQALGRAVDQRADIWALGCVLYECLTGRRAFSGDTSAEAIADVLRGDVDLGTLPPDTPLALRATIERCLRKDPAERWRSARDLWLAFTDASATRGAAPPTSGPPVSRPRRIAIAAALLASGAAAGVLLTTIARPRSGSDAGGPPTALEVRLPPNHALNLAMGPSVALSPDGRTLVYAASDGSSQRLYRRDLASFDSLVIPGTEGGRQAVFSPDGQSIAFFSTGKLVRMRLPGQRVEVCGIAPSAKGISWLDGAHLLYNPAARAGLARTKTAACESEKVTTVADTEPADHRWPEALPGGQSALFTALPQDGGVPRIMAVDLRTRQSTDVTEGSSPRFVPPRSLLFVRGALESGSAALFVAEFDLQTLSLSGEPSAVVGDVGVNIEGASHYSVPSLAHLAYVPSPGRVLRVLDPAGTVRKTILLNESADMVAVAPNGRKAIVALGSQLQVVDLSSGVAERLTYDPGRYKFPTWSQDSRRISYRFQRAADPAFRIMVIDAGGGAPREVGTVNAEPDVGGVSTWMPDGSALIGNHRGPRGDHDILRLLLDGKGTIEAVTNAPFGEYNARVSPDGKLLAFLSLELPGGFNVFVQPLQPGGARRRVSPQSSCTDPNWSPDGRQIFYRCSGKVYAATVSPNAGATTVGESRLIAERPLRGGVWLYGVLPDGGLVTMEQAQPASSVRVLLNWHK